MTVTIEIDRLRLYAYHGVLPHERTVGNTFEVSIAVDYPAEKAVETDSLDATLNYAEAIGIIRSVMAEPSELLEHVAGRIRKALLCRWPAITSGRIKVTKLNPPIDAITSGVSVTIAW